MSTVEHRDDGAVLLGDPAILKLEPDMSFVVVNAGEHPLDACTRELDLEAIAAMRDWCDSRLRGARRLGRPGGERGERSRKDD